MTVDELKEELKKYDGNIQVMVYAEIAEDGSMLQRILVETKNTRQLHFAGDHPFEYKSNLNKVVALVGE